MFIVLEGNECNFKTTISNKLSNALNYKIVKGSSFEQSSCTQDELFNKFLEYSQLDDVVLDRYYISNLVYADLYKDFAMISKEQQLHIEDILKGKNALIVYLFADTDTLNMRISKRGDNYVQSSKLTSINDKYNQILSTLSIPYIPINTNAAEKLMENGKDVTDMITNTIINLVEIVGEGTNEDGTT